MKLRVLQEVFFGHRPRRLGEVIKVDPADLPDGPRFSEHAVADLPIPHSPKGK